MKREITKLIFGIIGLLIASFLLCGSAVAVEFEAKGIIKRSSLSVNFTSDFDVYVNGEKYYIKYTKPVNPNTETLEFGYDGDYIRGLIRSPINVYDAGVFPGPVLQNCLDCEAGTIWLGLCSFQYFRSLKTNIICPILIDGINPANQPQYGFKCPANIEYLSKSDRALKSLEFYSDNLQVISRIKYEAIAFTNISGVSIPIHFKLIQICSNYLFTESKTFYRTNEIHEVFVNWITNKCSISNFSPVLTHVMCIYDGRFKGKPGYVSYLKYFSSNWLSDYELTNHPEYSNELNRIKLEQRVASISKNTEKHRYIQPIFIIFIIAALVPLGIMLYKITKKDKKDIKK